MERLKSVLAVLGKEAREGAKEQAGLRWATKGTSLGELLNEVFDVLDQSSGEGRRGGKLGSSGRQRVFQIAGGTDSSSIAFL